MWIQVVIPTLICGSCGDPLFERGVKTLNSPPPASGAVSLGILTWTQGPCSEAGPPKNSIIWHTSNGRTGRLCSNYLIKGLTCKRDRDCRFAHLNKVSDLSPENKKLFTQWVNETPLLAFTSAPRTPTTPPGNTPSVGSPP